ncbi:MAG TPA: YraN family protein [Kofleriaceae bacterium]|nr:YraN family protein [Kofleriaceae bacterium]
MSTTARGRHNEDRACEELVRRGYDIVERNYRCKLGELDVVARDGRTLVFVEVRSRSSARLGSALETIGIAKQRRIARVAQHYLMVRRPRFDTCRFDVIGITAGELVLIKDAFRL